jgi:hypothetical protein
LRVRTTAGTIRRSPAPTHRAGQQGLFSRFDYEPDDQSRPSVCAWPGCTWQPTQQITLTRSIAGSDTGVHVGKRMPVWLCVWHAGHVDDGVDA